MLWRRETDRDPIEAIKEKKTIPSWDERTLNVTEIAPKSKSEQREKEHSSH